MSDEKTQQNSAEPRQSGMTTVRVGGHIRDVFERGMTVTEIAERRLHPSTATTVRASTLLRRMHRKFPEGHPTIDEIESAMAASPPCRGCGALLRDPALGFLEDSLVLVCPWCTGGEVMRAWRAEQWDPFEALESFIEQAQGFIEHRGFYQPDHDDPILTAITDAREALAQLRAEWGPVPLLKSRILKESEIDTSAECGASVVVAGEQVICKEAYGHDGPHLGAAVRPAPEPVEREPMTPPRRRPGSTCDAPNVFESPGAVVTCVCVLEDGHGGDHDSGPLDGGARYQWGQ